MIIRDRSLPDSRGVLTSSGARLAGEFNSDNGSTLPPGAQVPCENHPPEIATVEGEPNPYSAVAAGTDPGSVKEGPQHELGSAYKSVEDGGLTKSLPTTANPDQPRFSIGETPREQLEITGRLPVTARPSGNGPTQGPAIWNPNTGKRGAY